MCKYSFCSGCLKYKLVRDGKKFNVCLRCSKLSSAVEPPVPQRTTQLHKHKSIESQCGGKVESASKSVSSKLEPQQTPKPNDDDLIRGRLDALKTNDHDPTTSDQVAVASCSSAGADGNIDIEKRLAALKGVEYKDYKNAAQRFMTPENRTEEQQIQDLIGRYADETTLNNVMDGKRLEQDEDIMRRLNALKEFPVTGHTGNVPPRPTALPHSDSDESVNEEEVATKLARQYEEEGKIAAKSDPDESDDDMMRPTVPANDEEELPWCTICNEDAVLRCKGCGNDLYCSSCYKEFHYDEDPREHKTEAFKPKFKKNS